MAKIHFIVNPLRPSIGLRWPYEEKNIASLTNDFEIHIIRGRQHGELLAYEAAKQNADLVVCVGGDSTLNEIANGIYRASKWGLQVPKLTVYAGLQHGDWVRSIPVRERFLDFLDAYLQGKAIEEKMDLGEAEFSGEYGQKVRKIFINCAGFGFSSVLVNKLSNDYRISRSKYSFLKLILRHVPFYRCSELDIFVDGEKLFGASEILTGLIHNGRFGAHGLELSSRSKPGDGVFEYTLVFKTFTYKYLLGILPLFASRLDKASFVHRATCTELRVQPSDGGRKIRIDLDGDSYGFLPARFRILPSALTWVR